MSRARYKLVVDALAADIRAGRLPPGTRLPTHRELASREKMALVTATRVYAELEAMGLVSGETGRGTFVRETSLPPGLGIDQHAVTPGMLDLNFNYPSVPGQAELLRQALRQLALAGDLEALLRYQPHGGRMHERACIARYLLARGVQTAAERVAIVNGAQHGLAVVAMALLRPGDVVATDALTYPGFKAVAQALHLELVPIPVKDDQPDLQALEHLCSTRQVRAVYTMPTLHNPLGWVLSVQWRERLVAIALRHELLIIEDAAYAFLIETPPPPIARLAPDITVYVSGLSKNIATGIRVGFVSAPLERVAALERAIRATTWNTPGVMTAIACGWLEDGTVERLEAEKRADAVTRQAIARRVLKGLAWVGHPNAYFLWLPLGEEVRADAIAKALLQQQVSVSTAEPFAVSPSTPHAIRLALGSVPLEGLEAALRKVRQVIDLHTC